MSLISDHLKVGQTSDEGAFSSSMFTTVAAFSLGFPIPPAFFVDEEGKKGTKNTFTFTFTSNCVYDLGAQSE